MWFKNKEEMEEHLKEKKVLSRNKWKVFHDLEKKEVQITLVKFQSFDWNMRIWVTESPKKLYYYM